MASGGGVNAGVEEFELEAVSHKASEETKKSAHKKGRKENAVEVVVTKVASFP